MTEITAHRGLFKDTDLHARSVVFASAVPSYLVKSDDNPGGPLSKAQADSMAADVSADEESFDDGFTTQFFSADGDVDLLVTEA